MANVSEKPISANSLASIQKCAASALAVLGVPTDGAESKATVEAIDTFVYQWQKGTRPSPQVLAPDDAPFIIGSLWGEELVKQFGWEWAMITFHDHGNSVAPGVLSKDRALAVYPIHFLTGCFKDPRVDATVLLSYNMLAGGKIMQLAAREYFNLMDGVRRIVPRA